MSQIEAPRERATIQPLPANITSVQPGGGVCYQIELAWGRLRRAYLRTFRCGYIARMAGLRRGDTTGAPHEILDPRDLKFCRNLCTAHWEEKDDPFRWRESIPFARWGLAELQLMSYPLLAATIGVALLPTPWSFAAVLPGFLLFVVVWFFRDPPRRLPQGENLLLSPADGKVVELTELDHHDFVGGPALRIGIFLTIFNVHINRAPSRCRVVALHYSPGKFLNAMDPESAIYNENMWMGLEEEAAPHRRFVARQIAGKIARRIVCPLRPGDVLERGSKFGMIKLGSRTELIVSSEGLKLDIKLGKWVKAGRDILAHYEPVGSPGLGSQSLSPRSSL